MNQSEDQPCLLCGHRRLFKRIVELFSQEKGYSLSKVEYECPCGFKWATFLDGEGFLEGSIRHSCPEPKPHPYAPDEPDQYSPVDLLLIIKEYPVP